MEAQSGAPVEATIEQKLGNLQESLRALRRVIVAFSAGVDSTFLLKVALDTLGPDQVLAVTARSDSLAAAEYDEALRLAEQLRAPLRVLETEEFKDPTFLANPANRCYYCKTELFTRLQRIAIDEGYNAILAGTNADDLSDFRPGIQAGKENNIVSPCADAGLTKNDIRVLSERMGLPTHDKPASPCLASRIPYGEAITPEKLRMIERGEAFLRSLGLRECRVRHHGNLARIEIPTDRIAECAEPTIRAKIDAEFRAIGYAYVTMDLRGFRSGSMNEVIAFGKKQPHP
ncbi:MAG: ATP-dependent sacrificial sulfur transferase LarE [Phycisphaerae bacterium]|nr:ATP-dependent sacrificial sulfur transferase LarE [Phycisphaerae bacterium]